MIHKVPSLLLPDLREYLFVLFFLRAELPADSFRFAILHPFSQIRTILTGKLLFQSIHEVLLLQILYLPYMSPQTTGHVTAVLLLPVFHHLTDLQSLSEADILLLDLYFLFSQETHQILS